MVASAEGEMWEMEVLGLVLNNETWRIRFCTLYKCNFDKSKNKL